MKRFLAYLVLVLAGAGAGAGYAAYSANTTATAATTRTSTTTQAPAAATQAGPTTIQGQVTAKEASSLTVKTSTGDQKFALSDQTRVNVAKPATVAALKPQVAVLVTGATGESGTFEATTISIQPAGGAQGGGAAGGQNGRAAGGTAQAGGQNGRTAVGTTAPTGGDAAQGNTGRNGTTPAGSGTAVAGGARGGNLAPGGARTNFLAGTITAIDGQNVTLTGPQGEEKFHIAANAKIVTQEQGTLDSITTGATVSVTEAGQGGASPRAVLVTVEAA